MIETESINLVCTTNEFGTIEYRLNGQYHRPDGPARIYSDGTEEYWLNGDAVDIMVHFLQRK